ncbi:lipopolysaccharide biosynthesis protein [Lysinibacillus sp. 3P01SB]|uniref:lipopolysaccharide biosynthesis protein n=1 Tax=Lysinibacillus sp. 3P01SB TaxID=3132284 RepID=UPI0039A6D23A
MNGEITRTAIIHSLFWKLLERGGSQVIQLLVMIILTRLLMPEDYGLIAIVAVFTSIAALLADSGFCEALIQKKHVEEVDFSSVFFLNLFIACLLYITLFFIAPYVAFYFESPQLKVILRILSLTVFISVFNSIQHAIIARNMQFKKLFKSSLAATFIASLVGIALAYTGFGIWALVGQQMTSQFLSTVLLWFSVKWRPKWLFSIKHVSTLYSFGWKLVASTLIYNFYTSLQSFVIGKLFSPVVLGYYSRGAQLPNILVSNINGSIQSVMFPALASQQHDKDRMKEMIRRSIITSSFVLFPLMMGLAVVAEPLVRLLFTEKWLPTAAFLQIFCGYYALWTIDSANLHAIKAVGRSDLFLRLEIVKFIVGTIILIISLPFGVYGVAIGVLVNRIITTILDAYPMKSLLGYSLAAQMEDILPSLLLSIGAGAIAYSIHFAGLSDMLTIVLQMIVGAALYIGLAAVFKMESFTYLIFTTKHMMKSERKITI